MSQENQNQEPNWLQPKFENIPEELKKQPWAVWKVEPRAGQPSKFNKAPLNPLTGLKVGANQPEKFGTFDQAKKAYESGRYTGVGVLLTGNQIVGIDIDNANELFEQRPDVKGWFKQAKKNGAYCEISPSRSGIRIFVLGAINGSGRKSGNLELYNDKRFLTVTGEIIVSKGASQ
jgi:putative DNA primase/helicase